MPRVVRTRRRAPVHTDVTSCGVVTGETCRVPPETPFAEFLGTRTADAWADPNASGLRRARAAPVTRAGEPLRQIDRSAEEEAS